MGVVMVVIAGGSFWQRLLPATIVHFGVNLVWFSLDVDSLPVESAWMPLVGTVATVLALAAIAAALMLAGCASGPERLEQAEVAAVMDAVDVQGPQRSTVAEALELSPHGTIGMVDARASSGVHDDAVTVPGAPGGDFLDWPIVAVCGSPNAAPSVLLVALPPDEVAAFEADPWGIGCQMAE